MAVESEHDPDGHVAEGKGNTSLDQMVNKSIVAQDDPLLYADHIPGELKPAEILVTQNCVPSAEDVCNKEVAEPLLPDGRTQHIAYHANDGHVADVNSAVPDNENRAELKDLLELVLDSGKLNSNLAYAEADVQPDLAEPSPLPYTDNRGECKFNDDNSVVKVSTSVNPPDGHTCHENDYDGCATDVTYKEVVSLLI